MSKSDWDAPYISTMGQNYQMELWVSKLQLINDSRLQMSL